MTGIDYSSQVFKWRVSLGTGFSYEFGNDELSFGDGYEQITGKGINEEITEYAVVMTRRPWDEIHAAAAFLREHRGRMPFWFVPEDIGSPILVRTRGPIQLGVDTSGRLSLRAIFKVWRGL